MDALPWEAWLAILTIAAATMLAVLHAFASAVRMEVHIHDTKLKAAKLRRVYAEQLAAMEAKRDLESGVEIVGQGAVAKAA